MTGIDENRTCGRRARLSSRRWWGALRRRGCCEGCVKLLLCGESIERAFGWLAAQMLVEEIQHRRPIVRRKGVTVAGEVHAKPILCTKERIRRPGGEDRLPHGFRQ